MDDVEFRQNFRLSSAAGHIFPPLQRAPLSREGLGYNRKQSMRSNRSRLQEAVDNVLVYLY